MYNVFTSLRRLMRWLRYCGTYVFKMARQFLPAGIRQFLSLKAQSQRSSQCNCVSFIWFSEETGLHERVRLLDSA